MNIHALIREDLPEDLTLDMNLNKLTPSPMHVPCLNGVGSCEYELCPMITDMGDQLCPSFPPGRPCGCPLKAGEITIVGLQLPVQDMGPIFGASERDKILACLEFTFSL